MPRLTHPKLPDRVIDVTDDLASVLAKSGWVPDTGTAVDEFWQAPADEASEPVPTDAPDDTSVEDDPTDPALAGNL